MTVPRKCQNCGEIFDAKKNSPSRKFCSMRCYAEVQRVAMVERKCRGCKAIFKVRRSEVQRGGGKYCSRECWRRYAPSPASRSDVADKISAAKVKSGRQVGRRQRQLEHAGFTLAAKGETRCRNCGSDRLLNLHHVIPRSTWKAGITEPLNGIPLCTSCHLGWHNRRVTIYRDVFTAEEWAFLTAVELTGQLVGPWLDSHYPERPREQEEVAR